MAASAVGNEEASRLFQETFTAFWDSLPLSERNKLEAYDHDDAATMIAAIRSDIDGRLQDPAHRRRLHSLSDKVRSFALRMEPFFSVIDIYVQTYPLYLAPFWGTIRLIFKLSSNYVEYLEKICNMFDSITAVLPVYGEYYNRLTASTMDANLKYAPRIKYALVQVYSDIICFCHRTITLFSTKCKGMRLRLNLIARRTWKPFDVEFQDLVERLRNHKQLFEYAVEGAEHQRAEEFYLTYEVEAKRIADEAQEQRKFREEELQRQENEMMNSQKERRKRAFDEWIQPPSWEDRFLETTIKRSSESCRWILQDSAYNKWKSRQDGASTILVIQAKPGFGKTTLCSLIIEDLKSELTVPVVYYFFSEEHDQQDNGVALRAILAQMLHHLRNNSQAVDIASTIFDERSTAQKKATNQEVLAILELLMQQFPGFNVVFDALDECKDPEELFIDLEKISSGFSDCNILFFSRPTVFLMSSVLEKACLLNLHSTDNSEDIKRFLEQELKKLAEESRTGKPMLPEKYSIDWYVMKIHEKANGMFLWASVFMKYIRTRSLSPDQRLREIENRHRMSKVDDIYREILEKLQEQNPGQASLNIQMGFRWVLGARRPLHVNEFARAVAIPFDRALTEDDLIVDLHQTMGIVFGSLLELSVQKTVHFTHLSAREFLNNKGDNEKDPRTTIPMKRKRTSVARNFFQATDVEINISAARSCLSYLSYTIPGEPLSGQISAVPDEKFQRERFPFLSYAARYWSEHLVIAIMEAVRSEERLIFHDLEFEELSDVLKRFLYDKSQITTWIEASWLFKSPPTVHAFPHETYLPRIPRKHKIRQLAEDVTHLARDVCTLNESWKLVLGSEPNEIWGHSIRGFTKSRFWSPTDDFRLIDIARPEKDEARSILLESKASQSGTVIGTARVFPPIPITSYEGWTGRYDLWNMQSNVKLRSITWYVDPDVLKGLFNNADEESLRRRSRFRFPISISDDLRRVLALNTVITIGAPGIDDSNEDMTIHNGSVSVLKTLWVTTRTVEHTLLQVELLGSGRVAVLFRPTFGIAKSKSTRNAREGLIEFYHDTNFGSGLDADYTCLASLKIYVDPDKSRNFLEKEFAHNGDHPQVAFNAFSPFGLSYTPESPQTYLWDFGDLIRSQKTLLDAPETGICVIDDEHTNDLNFSPDGKFIHGVNRKNGCIISRSVEECLNGNNVQTPSNSELTIGHREHHLSSLCSSESPTVQKVGELVFKNGGSGVREVSQLSKVEEEGAIVRQILDTDGKFQFQMLSRIPDPIRSSTVPAIINIPGEMEHEHVRLLLNKSRQESYSLEDTSGAALPAIVERSFRSIETYSSRQGFSLGEDARNHLMAHRTSQESVGGSRPGYPTGMETQNRAHGFG